MTRISLPSWSGAKGREWAQAKIINTLRQAAGGWISVEEMLEAVYGFNECDRGSLYTLVSRLRKRGWPIETQWGRGYRYAPELWKEET